ncbi:hypothetical protein cyc_08545 [Cyclospora cayetanensis]|uniref:Uncharacterized protein n=1 Tax=Cyclospora cayetanensis TaxID=88456 RepID=A0A1D3D4F4_9EIME|nr:hypothetical protein cyc_08545 [Cyclospora cayetanensis]
MQCDLRFCSTSGAVLLRCLWLPPRLQQLLQEAVGAHVGDLLLLLPLLRSLALCMRFAEQAEAAGAAVVPAAEVGAATWRPPLQTAAAPAAAAAVLLPPGNPAKAAAPPSSTQPPGSVLSTEAIDALRRLLHCDPQRSAEAAEELLLQQPPQQQSQDPAAESAAATLFLRFSLQQQQSQHDAPQQAVVAAVFDAHHCIAASYLLVTAANSHKAANAAAGMHMPLAAFKEDGLLQRRDCVYATVRIAHPPLKLLLQHARLQQEAVELQREWSDIVFLQHCRPFSMQLRLVLLHARALLHTVAATSAAVSSVGTAAAAARAAEAQQETVCLRFSLQRQQQQCQTAVELVLSVALVQLPEALVLSEPREKQEREAVQKLGTQIVLHWSSALTEAVLLPLDERLLPPDASPSTAEAAAARYDSEQIKAEKQSTRSPQQCTCCSQPCCSSPPISLRASETGSFDRHVQPLLVLVLSLALLPASLHSQTMRCCRCGGSDYACLDACHCSLKPDGSSRRFICAWPASYLLASVCHRVFVVETRFSSFFGRRNRLAPFAQLQLQTNAEARGISVLQQFVSLLCPLLPFSHLTRFTVYLHQQLEVAARAATAMPHPNGGSNKGNNKDATQEFACWLLQPLRSILSHVAMHAALAAAALRWQNGEKPLPLLMQPPLKDHFNKAERAVAAAAARTASTAAAPEQRTSTLLEASDSAAEDPSTTATAEEASSATAGVSACSETQLLQQTQQQLMGGGTTLLLELLLPKQPLVFPQFLPAEAPDRSAEEAAPLCCRAVHYCDTSFRAANLCTAALLPSCVFLCSHGAQSELQRKERLFSSAVLKPMMESAAKAFGFSITYSLAAVAALFFGVVDWDILAAALPPIQ